MASSQTATAVMPPGLNGSSAAQASIAPDSSADPKASDTAVLSQYPTSLVRILVLLDPIITLATRFVRLATWTGGKGTASHSFLLILAWWAICLYGYETIRYAPQALLLSVLFYTGLLRAFRGVSKAQRTYSRAASSESINKTIDELAELSDFISTMSTTLIEPLFALFTWRSFEETKALTIFLITTWPIWLLCFGERLWDVLGLPRIGLHLRRVGIKVFTYVSPTLRRVSSSFVQLGKNRFPDTFQLAEQLQSRTMEAFFRIQSVLLPVVHHVRSALPESATAAYPTRITILPPFPLFSLGIRHLLLILGTLALSWCSPWCALIRHALWRSALVRQSTRRAFALFSGRSQHSVRYQPPLLAPAEQSLSSQIFEKASFQGRSVAEISASTETSQGDKDFTRHEDVMYQFTIFENQRWWMGLDWTAALLPQERPSWADESNNPVSPPSSFSLPPAKTILKPSPTSTNAEAYIKRLVRWQWIDAEWTVAGRETGAESMQKMRRTSATSSTGTLFSNSTTTGTGDAGGASEENSRRMSLSSATNGSDLPSDLSWLDVDAEGWQYGDNSWEKMSRKGGLGRYTRRRRWIRRAVLVEVVQRNYSPAAEELASDNAGANIKEEDKISDVKTPTSPTTPTSPRTAGGADLKQSLARAAQGSSSE